MISYRSINAEAKFIVDNETLQSVLTALDKDVDMANPRKAEILFRRMAETGWALRSDIEEILYLLDSRLAAYDFKLMELSWALGIHWETIYYQANTRVRSQVGHSAARVDQAALLLILLQQLGFSVDISYLINLLLPGLKLRSHGLYSYAETEILWFERSRLKNASIHLSLKDAARLDRRLLRKFKTETGYEISVVASRDGQITGLKFSSPKFRNPTKTVPTVCQECGYQWERGDAESSHAHRKEHKKRMKYLFPQPSEKFRQERGANIDPELVRANSPSWKQREMYVRAWAFKHEFGYDFVQWEDEKSQSDPHVQGFLFADDSDRIVGACVFRDRTGTSDTQLWGLQWIWICPTERRKGHLAARWEMLRAKFGDFTVEAPVSSAMKGFLERQGDNALLE